jgi:hypothetical protein
MIPPLLGERVAEGRVRDQRGKLTAAAEGGRDLFPQGLDSAFPKQAETCVLINKINRFHKNGPLKSWGHWTCSRLWASGNP